MLKSSSIEKVPSPKVFIAVLGTAAEKESLAIVDRLRKEGIWMELGYTGNSLKSQMRRADKLSAEYVFIIGDDEITAGKLKWKKLSDGSQGEMLFTDISRFFKITSGNKREPIPQHQAS